MIAVATFILGFCIGVTVMAIFFSSGRADMRSEIMLLQKKLRNVTAGLKK